MAALADLLHVFGEALEAARPAVLVLVARIDGLEHRLVQRELRLLAFRGEAHRQHGFMAALAGLVLPRPGANDALGWCYLAIEAAQPVIDAIRPTHQHEERAARAKIHLAARQ